MNEEITINFDLANKRDKIIFDGIKRLPKYFGIDSTSEAFLRFMGALIISLVECEERKEKCEEAVRQIFGKKVRH